MVFQFHQCIFHEIQKNVQPIRLPCKGDRIHSSPRPYRCHCVHSDRVSFHGDKCQTFRQCVDVSWMIEDSRILLWFQCGKKHTQRANSCKSRPDLMNLLEVCVAALLWQVCTWNMAARSFLLCPKIHSKVAFREVFSDRNRQKYSSFCTFLRTWMKKIRLSEGSSDCKNENRRHLIKGAPLQNLQPPGTKALQHDDTVGKADAWHPKARREHQNSNLDFRCQCIQSFSSNTNRNQTERFSAQVASGEELLRANYLPAGYPNS